MTTAISAFLTALGATAGLIIAIGAQNAFIIRQGVRKERVALIISICIASDVVLIGLGVFGTARLLQSHPWLMTLGTWLGAAFLIGYGVHAAWRACTSKEALDTGAIDVESIEAATAEHLTGSRHAPSREVHRSVGSDGLLADGVVTGTLTLPLQAEREGRGGHGPGRSEPRPATAKKSALSIALATLAFTWLNPHAWLDTVVLIGSVATGFPDDRVPFYLGAITASVTWFLLLGLASRVLGRVLSTPKAWRILDLAIAIIMIGLGVSLLFL